MVNRDIVSAERRGTEPLSVRATRQGAPDFLENFRLVDMKTSPKILCYYRETCSNKKSDRPNVFCLAICDCTLVLHTHGHHGGFLVFSVSPRKMKARKILIPHKNRDDYRTLVPGNFYYLESAV